MAKGVYDDPAAFWTARGKGPTPEGESFDPTAGSTPSHLRAEAALAEALYEHRLLIPGRIQTIFEAGCGKGRIAYLTKRILPKAFYYGIDFAKPQLAVARKLRPDGIFIHADLLTYEEKLYEDTAFVGYDLVISAETLMHIRPQDVEKAFRQLIDLTRPGGYLLLLEWVPKPAPTSARGSKPEPAEAPAPEVIAPWNWAHNYMALFHKYQIRLITQVRTDLQMIYLVAP